MRKLFCEMKSPGKARLNIYSDIGPARFGMVDSAAVQSQLDQLGDVDEIEVHLNSRGGDGWHGLAIHNQLRDHPAKVTVIVDGIAASAASLILMAGDERRVPKNALVMIHEPSTLFYGGIDDLKRAMAMLEATLAAGVETYAKRTKKSAERIRQMMAAETWLTGEQAVAEGFADVTEPEIKVKKSVAQAVLDSPFAANAPADWSALWSVAYDDDGPAANVLIADIPYGVDSDCFTPEALTRLAKMQQQESDPLLSGPVL